MISTHQLTVDLCRLHRESRRLGRSKPRVTADYIDAHEAVIAGLRDPEVTASLDALLGEVQCASEQQLVLYRGQSRFERQRECELGQRLGMTRRIAERWLGEAERGLQSAASGRSEAPCVRSVNELIDRLEAAMETVRMAHQLPAKKHQGRQLSDLRKRRERHLAASCWILLNAVEPTGFALSHAIATGLASAPRNAAA